jgi:hypothetical protein
VDVTTINCLKCVLLINTSYIIKAEQYGIECDLAKYILLRDTAYNYLLINRTECDLPIAFLTQVKKFTRLNCITCG